MGSQIALGSDAGEHAIGVKYAALDLYVSHMAFDEKCASLVMPYVLAEDVTRRTLIAVNPQITPAVLAMASDLGTLLPLSERGGETNWEARANRTRWQQ